MQHDGSPLEKTTGEGWPFSSWNQAVSADRGGIIARLPGGRPVRLAPGYSLLCPDDDVDDLSERVAVSALMTDDEGSYIVHDAGTLRRRTSLHRSAIGDAMMLGDAGRYGCSIEPLHAAWLPVGDGQVRLHVDAIMRSLAGREGPDEHLFELLVQNALSLMSQSSDVTLGDVLRKTGRHQARARGWTEHDLAFASQGRMITPADLRGARPATVYVDRGPDPSTRRERIARTVQTAILRNALGGVDVHSPRHLVSVMHGATTWGGQTHLNQVPDLGRSKLTGQIMTGGSRADLVSTFSREDVLTLEATIQAKIFADPSGEGVRLSVHGKYMECAVTGP